MALYDYMEFTVALAIYAYTAYTLQVIAKKTSTPRTWRAWVPLLNIFLLVKVAEKSYWWVLWNLIPIVNWVITAILWMRVAVRLGKPKWLGLLMLVPIANFIVMGYLAFASKYQDQKVGAN